MKYFLGVLMGFLLNSGMRTYYNYSWWKTEEIISNEEFNNSIKEYGYAKIIGDKMGPSSYFRYPLITGDYSFRTWHISYP